MFPSAYIRIQCNLPVQQPLFLLAPILMPPILPTPPRAHYKSLDGSHNRPPSTGHAAPPTGTGVCCGVPDGPLPLRLRRLRCTTMLPPTLPPDCRDGQASQKHPPLPGYKPPPCTLDHCSLSITGWTGTASPQSSWVRVGQTGAGFLAAQTNIVRWYLLLFTHVTFPSHYPMSSLSSLPHHRRGAVRRRTGLHGVLTGTRAV